MIIWSENFEDNCPIPEANAFGKYNPEIHVELSENKNPNLKWNDTPEGTKSFVLICHDPDVPSIPDDVNQEGKTVPSDLPRCDFYHWTLLDIPTNRNSIAEGEFSSSITAKGKPGPKSKETMRQGINNYTQWFEGDDAMAGKYFGYDGPCPPWNDEIIHHYHFTIYALDIERAPIEDEFYAPEVLKAIEPHILAKATVVGTYHIYPQAK